MLVVCCHPEHYPQAFVDDVLRLEREVEDLLHAWCDVSGGSQAQLPNALAKAIREYLFFDRIRLLKHFALQNIHEITALHSLVFGRCSQRPLVRHTTTAIGSSG